MAQLITISALKGGVGKSTLTYNLAYYFQSKKLQVVVVDCDVGQFSILKTLTGIQTLSREQVRSWSDFAKGARESSRDIVLIDTGPYRTLAELGEIHAISDFVLIPTRASRFDVDSLKGTLEVYRNALTQSPPDQVLPKAGILLTMSRKNARLYKEMREQLEAKNYPVFDAEMEFRTAWEASVGVEGGLLKLKPKDAKALKELRAIGEELLKRIKT